MPEALEHVLQLSFARTPMGTQCLKVTSRPTLQCPVRSAELHCKGQAEDNCIGLLPIRRKTFSSNRQESWLKIKKKQRRTQKKVSLYNINTEQDIRPPRLLVKKQKNKNRGMLVARRGHPGLAHQLCLPASNPSVGSTITTKVKNFLCPLKCH